MVRIIEKNDGLIDLSIIVPAYNASGTLEAALQSIVGPLTQTELTVELVVVNDGSRPEEAEAMRKIVAGFPQAILLDHDQNRGMCAARNSGFSASRGAYVTLLDSDDVYIEDWPAEFEAIKSEWPEGANAVFTPCVNQADQITASQPDYVGWLTAEDMINQKYSGEYNPIFIGDYARENLYNDLGTGKSCGLLTYLRLLQHHPFWISSHVQRRYHDAVVDSVSHGWTRKEKAAETFTCFSAVLKSHGALIKQTSDRRYLEFHYKILIYKMLAGQGRDVFEGLSAFSIRAFPRWFATMALLVVGPSATRFMLHYGKNFGVLRRYG